MTPTLLGRWQIRLFLLSTVGLVISILIGGIYGNIVPALLGLGTVLAVGCILDILYQYIQSFRWDADWPTSFQVGAGILEGLLVFFLIHPPQDMFLWQYGSIWLITFLLIQGPLRILWPKWRYQGGEWLSIPAHRSQNIPSRSPSIPTPVQNPPLVRSSLPSNVASPLPPPWPPLQQKP